MTTEVSTLGIKVESGDAVKAAGDLDRLAQSADKAEGAVDGLTKTSGKAGEKFSDWADRMKAASTTTATTTAAAAGLGAAFGVLAGEAIGKAVAFMYDFGKASIEAFAHAEESVTKLNAMLKLAGSSVRTTGDEIVRLGVEIQNTTNYSSTAVVEATNRMLKFGEVSGTNLERAIKLSTNLAAITGQDLPAAAEMVGRALENSYGTMMLRRMGLLTDTQIEYLKQLKETGDEARYLEAMFSTLEQKAGDLAKEIGGEGLAGATKQLSNEWSLWMEGIGKFISEHAGLEDKLRTLKEHLQALREGDWWTKYGYSTPPPTQKAPPGWPEGLPGQIPTGGNDWLSAVGGGPRAPGYDKAVTEEMKKAQSTLKELDSILSSYNKKMETVADVTKMVNDVWKSNTIAGEQMRSNFLTQTAATEKYTAAWKALHKGTKEGADQLDATYVKLLSTAEHLDESDSRRIKFQEEIAAATKKDPRITGEVAAAWLKLYDIQEAALRQEKEIADYDKTIAAQRKQDAADSARFIQSVDKEVEAEKAKAIELRGGKAAMEEHRIATAEDTLAILERIRAIALSDASDEDYIKNLDEQIRKQRELVAARKDTASAQYAKDAADAAKKVQEQWDRTSEQLAGSLADAIMRGFEEGKSFAKNFLDTLKNWFAQTILRPVIQFIISPLTGLMQGIFGGMGQSVGSGLFGGVAGGGGFGGIGGGLGGMWNAFSGGASSAMAGFISGPIGQAVGLSNYGAAMAAGAGDLSAVGTSALGPGLVAAAPWLAMAAVAVPLVMSFLNSKRGGPKTEGYASTGPVDLAGTGYTDAGRWMTGTGQDATILSSLKDVKNTYAAWVKALGGTAGAEFAQGWSMDPKGTAPSNVHTGVWVGGQNVYNAANPNVGRTQEELDAEIALQTKQALLAALQHSDLPEAIATYLNTVDAAAATSEQVDTMLQMADAMAAVWKLGDPLKDAMDAFAMSTEGAMKNLARMRTALLDQAKEFDGSAEAATNLASATQEFYQAAVATLAQIEQLKKDVSTAFGGSADRYRLATMNQQQQYDWYQLQVSKLESELKTTTDAQRIAEIAGLINQYQGTAFGMLNPDQQKSMGEAFAKAAEYANELVQKQLKDAGDIVRKDTNDTLQAVRDTLAPPAKDLKDAAGDLKEAAKDLVRAANTPIDVSVDVSDRGDRGSGAPGGHNVTGGA